MPSRYAEFDRRRLSPQPLGHRRHNLTLDAVLPLRRAAGSAPYPCRQAAQRLWEARQHGRATVLMMGAHVLRSGVQRYIIDLLERGFLSCIAMNGAGVIHDYEFALIGATTESVARYLKEGQFGLWTETGELNGIVKEGADAGLGLGEAVGKAILERGLPNRELSVLAAAYKAGVPVTVHVGIGYDIVHEMPNCDGGAYGAASYRDFLIFAKVLERVAGGVVMNFGSAVMGPEVFLKALSMVRNVAARRGETVDGFLTLVCDLKPLPADYRQEPAASDPNYYFRPWKTMLVRSVQGAGESYYLEGRHSETFPCLWSCIDEGAGLAPHKGRFG